MRGLCSLPGSNPPWKIPPRCKSSRPRACQMRLAGVSGSAADRASICSPGDRRLRTAYLLLIRFVSSGVFTRARTLRKSSCRRMGRRAVPMQDHIGFVSVRAALHAFVEAFCVSRMLIGAAAFGAGFDQKATYAGVKSLLKIIIW